MENKFYNHEPNHTEFSKQSENRILIDIYIQFWVNCYANKFSNTPETGSI